MRRHQPVPRVANDSPRRGGAVEEAHDVEEGVRGACRPDGAVADSVGEQRRVRGAAVDRGLDGFDVLGEIHAHDAAERAVEPAEAGDAGVIAVVDDPHNIGVPQPGQPFFDFETQQQPIGLIGVEDIGPYDLDRHLARVADVIGLIDGGHTALAQLLQDMVLADVGTNHEQRLP